MVARKRPPGSSSGSKSGTQLDTPDIDKVPDPSIRSEKYDEEELDEIWYNVKTFFLGCFVFLLFGIMITSCAMGFWMLIAATLKKQGGDITVIMETTTVAPIRKTTKKGK